MFDKKDKTNSDQREAEDLLSSLSALRLEVQTLQQTTESLERRIEKVRAVWVGAAGIVASMERMRTDAIMFNENIAIRVGSLESQLCGILQKQYVHEQVFRTLGADLMLRNKGAGSVAPSGPTSKEI